MTDNKKTDSEKEAPKRRRKTASAAGAKKTGTTRKKSAGKTTTSEKKQADDTQSVQQAILTAALPLVPFSGWTVKTLRAAAEEAGYTREDQRRVFPRGVADLIAFWSDEADKEAEAIIAGSNLDAMRIRERVTFAVRTRLEVWAEHQDAVHKAKQLLLLPFYASLSTRLVYRTCDMVWRAIGDQSTDFNFYSKRGVLSLVWTSTLAVWVRDDSQGFEESWAFLDRRISNVMQFEKVKAQATKLADRVPSPWGFLGALRYPSKKPDI